MDKLTTKEIAIEFAKHLMQRTVRKHTDSENFTDYVPAEYKLLNGELVSNGSELFDDWAEENFILHNCG